MYYFIIYKTTNIETGKFYIGFHKTKNLNDDYLGSGKYLQAAIKKYGKEKFNKEVLFICKDEEDMKNKEKEILTDQFLLKNTGKTYNLLTGGKGGFSYINKNHLENINHDNKNEEAIKKLKRAVIQFKYLMKNNEEFKKKHSDRIKDGILLKRKSPVMGFLGKNHSEDSKNKIRKSNKLNHFGVNNSQFGNCWIYKDNICKTIKKEEFQNWELQGWKRGRVFSPEAYSNGKKHVC